MNVTFSQAAEMILSRSKHFRERILESLDSLPGSCFIDGRIGRTPANDELILMCQGHSPITVPHEDFGDPATLLRIGKEWLNPE